METGNRGKVKGLQIHRQRTDSCDTLPHPDVEREGRGVESLMMPPLSQIDGNCVGREDTLVEFLIRLEITSAIDFK